MPPARLLSRNVQRDRLGIAEATGLPAVMRSRAEIIQAASFCGHESLMTPIHSGRDRSPHALNKRGVIFLKSMSRMLRRDEIVAALIALSIALSGCSSGLGLWPVVQSHVPASGTTIVRSAKLRDSERLFFTWGGLPDFLHSDLQAEAVREAIRVKRGDLLIDYTLSVRVTRFPLGLFLIELNAWWITWTAEGIASKAQPEIPEPAGQDIESPPASREMIPR